MTAPAPVAETAGREWSPIVVQDGLGSIHAFSSYASPVDGRLRLYMSTYNGATFGTPQLVSTWWAGVLGSAAVKESGGAISLVMERRIYPYDPNAPVNTELYWTRNAGAGWSAPVPLTSYFDRDTQPTLVALADGKLGLVFSKWIPYDANGSVLSSYIPNDISTFDHVDMDLYQMTYDPSTGWSAATPIATTPFTSEAYPTLAQGPSGKLFLFYSSNVGGNWSLVWRKYESGVWGAPSILEFGLMAQYLQQPSLINDVPGKYRLVYAQKNFCPNINCPTAADGFSSEIRYRTYDSVTNIWANPVSLTSASQFYADQPSAIYDSNGTYWLIFRYFGQTNLGGVSNSNANTDVYWIKSLPNTPVGTNVNVDLGYGSSITFSNVTVEGSSTIDTATTNPGNVPGVFKIGDFYYDINTNATYTGNMIISLKYSDSGMTPEQEASLRILHWLTASQTWEDATISVDTVNNILIGQVSSLSWIAIASGPVITWHGPISNINEGETYALNDGSTLPIKFSFKDSTGSFVYDPNVSVTVSGNGNGNGGSKTFFLGSGDEDIRYDAVTGQYIVNLHTKLYDWIQAGQTYEVKASNTYTGSDGWRTSFTVLDGGKAQGKNR